MWGLRERDDFFTLHYVMVWLVELEHYKSMFIAVLKFNSLFLSLWDCDDYNYSFNPSNKSPLSSRHCRPIAYFSLVPQIVITRARKFTTLKLNHFCAVMPNSALPKCKLTLRPLRAFSNSCSTEEST